MGMAKSSRKQSSVLHDAHVGEEWQDMVAVEPSIWTGTQLKQYCQRVKGRVEASDFDIATRISDAWGMSHGR